MAKVVVTMKIMPQSPEIDLSSIEDKISFVIRSFEGSSISFEKQPIGFGLVALILKFSIDEAKGGTDEIENKLKEISGVQSVEVTMVSRALG